jgi:23S rRNA pseudouridine1911/1915/1917 synthase
VSIAGAVVEASHTLSEGDLIRVQPEEPALTRAAPESDVRFDVMYVDDDIVVVNKPPGLVVHPARGHEAGTLVNGLLARGYFLGQAFADGADPQGHTRPGIVHRLDAGTSGVMIVARTAEAREKLKSQFQAHTIERAYQAIVLGEMHDCTLSTLHGRHPRDRLRFTTRVRQGKRAVTRVRVVAPLHCATHIECTLETGRTHQIRVQLAERGASVLGDPLYGKPPSDPRLRQAGERLGHQALHARLLGLVHPRTGERVRFEISPPQDFVEALETLRL